MTGEPTAIREAADAALRGDLIVIPTDTVYGIGTRPDRASATARLFEAKGRPQGSVVPVLAPFTEDAREITVFDERAERLATGFWPGALTLVLPRTERSAAWELGGDSASVGVRVPAHEVARAVLEITGPLAVTSANISGLPPLATSDELLDTFGDSVSVYLCEEVRLVGVASTVVDLTGPSVRFLRRGDVAEELIREVADGGTA